MKKGFLKSLMYENFDINFLSIFSKEISLNSDAEFTFHEIINVRITLFFRKNRLG